MSSSSSSSDQGSSPNASMLATGAAGRNTATTTTTTTQHHAADHQNINLNRKLGNACMKGDWESARQFFEAANSDDPIWTAPIDKMRNTALSVAAMSGQTIFLEKLVALMPVEALLAQDDQNFTVLHNVATNGNVKAAKILVGRSPNLTQIPNEDQETPLLRAAIFGHEDLLRYLLSVTKDEDTSETIGGVTCECPSPFKGKPGATLLVTAIDANLYDVALKLVQDHPEISTMKDNRGKLAIQVLATKSWPSIENRGRVRFWHRHTILGKLDMVFSNVFKELVSSTIVSCINYKTMYKRYLKLVKLICDQVEKSKNEDEWAIIDGTVLKASEHGNVDFIESIVSIDHNQIVSSIDHNQIVSSNGAGSPRPNDFISSIGTCPSMLHNAVKHRQKKVFYYLKDLGLKDELALKTDENLQETILHFAAKIAPSRKLKQISSPALQMQHEFQWYKEVEKIVQPSYRDQTNKEGESPREMFTREHVELLEKGEKWMKHMAESSMVVATLIATVVFAAAFTVPGGNNQDKGIPIFLSKRAYTVFAVSNAIAFFSSLTSVLMFLSILTARYAEEDFLKSLPRRLVISLLMLFIATAFIATYFLMTAAFIATFIATYFLMIGHKRLWISILIAVLTSIPVVLFALLHVRLFFEMIKSTYISIL